MMSYWASRPQSHVMVCGTVVVKLAKAPGVEAVALHSGEALQDVEKSIDDLCTK
jgi:hypothetical protein